MDRQTDMTKSTLLGASPLGGAPLKKYENVQNWTGKQQACNSGGLVEAYQTWRFEGRNQAREGQEREREGNSRKTSF